MTADAMRQHAVIAVLAAAVLIGCGGAPDLPSSSAVSVTVQPSTAAIKVGETVDLHGTATGFTNPTINWWQQDQHDTAVNGYGSMDCDYINDANTNLIPSCKYGYLTNSPTMQASSATATYHAPMTPGTYHVTFHASQLSTQQYGAGIERRATAVITVTM